VNELGKWTLPGLSGRACGSLRCPLMEFSSTSCCNWLLPLTGNLILLSLELFPLYKARNLSGSVANQQR
jgi:hypothetical protein